MLHKNKACLRTTFTPIFSSGKMKLMMVFINETGQRLTTAMDKLMESGKEFEAKSIFGKFSMDTIASCAYGVDAKVWEGSSSTFVENAKKMFDQTPVQMLKFMLTAFIPFGPNIMKTFGMSVFLDKETMFFYDIIMQTLKAGIIFERCF